MEIEEAKVELSIMFREYIRNIPDYHERSLEERNVIVEEFMELVKMLARIQRNARGG